MLIACVYVCGGVYVCVCVCVCGAEVGLSSRAGNHTLLLSCLAGSWGAQRCLFSLCLHWACAAASRHLATSGASCGALQVWTGLFIPPSSQPRLIRQTTYWHSMSVSRVAHLVPCACLSAQVWAGRERLCRYSGCCSCVCEGSSLMYMQLWRTWGSTGSWWSRIWSVHETISKVK